jgi:5'-nucleotidase
MTILVTNDDGIYAPGLAALQRALSGLGEVVVVAPDRPRSATGHAITLHKPLRINTVELPGDGTAYMTNGTPSDCVVLGMMDLLDEQPALVVAGINLGPNLGEDLTYSGTVSAAMEASLMGVPAFAISVASYEAQDYGPAARYAERLAREIIESGLPPGTLLNVNVPDLPEGKLGPVAVTRQGRRRYEGRLERRLDPRGRPYFWLAGEVLEEADPGGTDVEAVNQGRISVTPVRLDLTADDCLDELRARLA